MNQSSRRVRRKVDGVLLFDKSAGLTSNACLGVIKRLYSAAKAGHTGTLDPFATGLLPVALGEATKFTRGLLEADKTYLATMHLGVVTETGDIEGAVLETRPVRVEEADLQRVLGDFVGAIEQIPPMHSALKRDGKPLYEYARQGIVLERAARHITIHSLELSARRGDHVDFRVHCSKGTYVRTLAEDIGRVLGCGAHLHALRREKVGDLCVADGFDAQALEDMSAGQRDACLLGVDALTRDLPRLQLDAESARRVRLGQRVPVADPLAPHGELRAYDADGAFLGLLRVADGVAHPLRLVNLE